MSALLESIKQRVRPITKRQVRVERDGAHVLGKVVHRTRADSQNEQQATPEKKTR